MFYQLIKHRILIRRFIDVKSLHVMYYRPFDRSMDLWIINKFMKLSTNISINILRASRHTYIHGGVVEVRVVLRFTFALFQSGRYFIMAMGIRTLLIVTLLALPLTNSSSNWRWRWQRPSLGPVSDARTHGSVVVMGMIQSKWQSRQLGKSWWQACLRVKAIKMMAERRRIASLR